jgi:hypothetical protein
VWEFRTLLSELTEAARRQPITADVDLQLGRARAGEICPVRDRRRLLPGTAVAEGSLPALAPFLLTPSSATKRERVRVVLVVLSTFVCSLVAQLPLSGSGGRTIIVAVMATMLVAVVVSIAGGDQDDQEASRQKTGENCFQGVISFSRFVVDRGPRYPGLLMRCVTILPHMIICKAIACESSVRLRDKRQSAGLGLDDYLGHRDPKHTDHYTRVAGSKACGNSLRPKPARHSGS